MKSKRNLKSMAVAAASVLVAAGAVFLPRALFKIEDGALLSAPHKRTVQGGNLAAGASDIYIVNAIWARDEGRRADGWSEEWGIEVGKYYSYYEGEHDWMELEYAVNQVADCFEELWEAGVLPPGLEEEIAALRWRGFEQYYRSMDVYGFEDVSISAYQYPQGAFIRASVMLETKTQKVVNMGLAGSADMRLTQQDLDEMAANHRAYLELDGLDDWEPVWQNWYEVALQEYEDFYMGDMLWNDMNMLDEEEETLKREAYYEVQQELQWQLDGLMISAHHSEQAGLLQVFALHNRNGETWLYVNIYPVRDLSNMRVIDAIR